MNQVIFHLSLVLSLIFILIRLFHFCIQNNLNLSYPLLNSLSKTFLFFYCLHF